MTQSREAQIEALAHALYFAYVKMRFDNRYHTWDNTSLSVRLGWISAATIAHDAADQRATEMRERCAQRAERFAQINPVRAKQDAALRIADAIRALPLTPPEQAGGR